MAISKINYNSRELVTTPAFLVTATAATNFSKDSNNTVAFGTEVFDQNGDFASNTFTAPVTGKYLLSASVQIANTQSDATYYIASIVTSNRTLRLAIEDPTILSAPDDVAFWTFSAAHLMDMDASDTATITYRQEGGTNTVSDLDTDTSFSGFLVA